MTTEFFKDMACTIPCQIGDYIAVMQDDYTRMEQPNLALRPTLGMAKDGRLMAMFTPKTASMTRRNLQVYAPEKPPTE